MYPVDIDKIDMKTPTTHAIPTTTTSEAPRRSGIVRNPSSVTAAICLSVVMVYRPASASTMFSRLARNAGSNPLTNATSKAKASPVRSASHGI